MSIPVIAAGAAVIIVLVVVGSALLTDLFKERAKLIREQRVREDRELQNDRARENYERDIKFAANIFDPLGLVS